MFRKTSPLPPTSPAGPSTRGRDGGPATQKVMIVNGTSEIMDVIESVLDAGNYDVVFVESTEHGYSQIRRVRPNLVILCLDVEALQGFQVLSMLRLDNDTRSIPVLTFTIEPQAPEADQDEEDADQTPELFTRTPPPSMN